MVTAKVIKRGFKLYRVAIAIKALLWYLNVHQSGELRDITPLRGMMHDVCRCRGIGMTLWNIAGMLRRKWKLDEKRAIYTVLVSTGQ